MEYKDMIDVDMNNVSNSDIYANTVQEYLTCVDNVFKELCLDEKSCQIWYRGQSNKNYDLVPRIARGGINPEYEIIYLSKFKSLALPYVQNSPNLSIPNFPAAYWHWLILMQHNGVPTRLLDWTRDALTALYFAVNKINSEPKNDAAVWVLNPVTLNRAFSFHSFVKSGYIPNLDEQIIELYFGPKANILDTKKPAAVIAPLNNTNIAAQRGVFTVFPLVKDITALNLFPDSSRYLIKICISKESILSIKQQLLRYGITNLSLYPGIDSIAQEIKLEAEQEGQLPNIP